MGTESIGEKNQSQIKNKYEDLPKTVFDKDYQLPLYIQKNVANKTFELFLFPKGSKKRHRPKDQKQRNPLTK